MFGLSSYEDFLHDSLAYAVCTIQIAKVETMDAMNWATNDSLRLLTHEARFLEGSIFTSRAWIISRIGSWVARRVADTPLH